MTPGNLRPYTHLVNLVAKRSSLLLDGGPAGSQEYMRWVRSLEQDFGVRIEVRTIMGADNRPAAIGGTISSAATPAGSPTPSPASASPAASPAGPPTPSACAGVPGAREAMPSDCQLAFTVDGDETRCALRYCCGG